MKNGKVIMEGYRMSGEIKNLQVIEDFFEC